MTSNHSTRVFRCDQTDEQRAEFEASGRQRLCRHCNHPPPEGDELREIPATGPYQARAGSEATFCSTACMMAFTLERPTYRSQMQQHAITKLHYEETDSLDPVCAAPPQSQLDIYGGPWSIATFRAQSRAGRLVRRCEPPFASQMTFAIAEVYQTDMAMDVRDDGPVEVRPEAAPAEDEAGMDVQCELNEWGLTNLQRPANQPPDLMEDGADPEASVYGRYLERVQAVPGPAEDGPADPKPKRARPPPGSVGGGGLTRYLVRK
jgi:hypothetical protein